MNNNRLHSNSPSPAKRSRTESNSEREDENKKLNGGLNLDMLNYPLSHFNEIKSKILANTAAAPPQPTPSEKTSVIRQPIPSTGRFNPVGGGKSISLLLPAESIQTRPISPKIKSQTTLLNTASEIANNHITVKRITELEFELGHTKLKNKDLTQLVQMLNAKFILAQRALEEKELIIKKKDKSIEQLNLELERRERILWFTY